MPSSETTRPTSSTRLLGLSDTFVGSRGVSGRHAWTGAHDVWLRCIGGQLGLAATRMKFESDYDAVLTA